MIRKSSTVEIGLSGLNGALVPLPTLKASTKVFIAELAFCLRKLLDGGQPVWLVPQSLARLGGFFVSELVWWGSEYRFQRSGDGITLPQSTYLNTLTYSHCYVRIVSRRPHSV